MKRLRRALARLFFRIARVLDPSIGEVVNYIAYPSYEDKFARRHEALDHAYKALAKRLERLARKETP